MGLNRPEVSRMEQFKAARDPFPPSPQVLRASKKAAPGVKAALASVKGASAPTKTKTGQTPGTRAAARE